MPDMIDSAPSLTGLTPSRRRELTYLARLVANSQPPISKGLLRSVLGQAKSEGLDPESLWNLHRRGWLQDLSPLPEYAEVAPA